MKKLGLLLVMALTFNLVGCSPWFVRGSDGKLRTWTSAANEFAQDLNLLAGGPVFKVEKARTWQTGFVVLSYTCYEGADPAYFAIDMRYYHPGGSQDLLNYVLGSFGPPGSPSIVHIPGMFFFLSKNASSNEYTYTDFDGNQVVFAEDAEVGHDVEGMGSQEEREMVANVSNSLVAKYGFSVERAETVAKLASSYQQIASKRSLTEVEQNKFARELVGADFAKVQNALGASDNSQDFNDLINTAAQKNGINPEQVSAMLSDLLTK